METTNKIKKAFPIASVLFLLSVIAVAVAQVITTLQNVYSYTSMGMSTDLFIGSVVVSILVAVIGTIPYILMAIFAFNTSKKPSVPYVVVFALITFGTVLAIPGSLTSLINTLSIEYSTQSLILTTVFNFVARVFFALTLVALLIFTIVMKTSKKPSKLSNIWFVFCTPAILYFVSTVINGYYGYCYASEQLSLDPTAPVNVTYSILSMVASSLDALISTGAFFCISNQFAKVNKNLPTD